LLLIRGKVAANFRLRFELEHDSRFGVQQTTKTARVLSISRIKKKESNETGTYALGGSLGKIDMPTGTLVLGKSRISPDFAVS